MLENEQILINACIAGERTFQTKLFNTYATKMMVVCSRYARDKQEAEAIMLEGFMRVFTYLNKFKGEGSLEGWIRKIMINCAVAQYQKKIHLTPVIEINIEHATVTDHKNVIADISAKELLALVQKLSPAYRLVFNLYVFEGYKHFEIAELLGISEGTSKSNLSDARKIIQKALKKKDSISGKKQIKYGKRSTKNR